VERPVTKQKEMFVPQINSWRTSDWKHSKTHRHTDTHTGKRQKVVWTTMITDGQSTKGIFKIIGKHEKCYHHTNNLKKQQKLNLLH
jgi:hypothetical protein